MLDESQLSRSGAQPAELVRESACKTPAIPTPAASQNSITNRQYCAGQFHLLAGDHRLVHQIHGEFYGNWRISAGPHLSPMEHGIHSLSKLPHQQEILQEGSLRGREAGCYPDSVHLLYAGRKCRKMA